MTTTEGTLARLQEIAGGIGETRPDRDGNTPVDTIELDFLVQVALASTQALIELERVTLAKTAAGPQPIRVVQKDDGVDGSPILGYVTEAELPLHEAFIAGYNQANKSQMTGDLEIVELAPFDISSLD